MRIIFFGTSEFAAKILQCLVKKNISIQAIVTQPDRAKNRSSKLVFSPVKQLAIQSCSNVSIFQPEKASHPEFIQTMKQLAPDLMIVVAYGQILKKELLDIPKLAPINIHASLLPKYRGAAPIQRCLMQGEDKTGITIIKMNSQMDAGEIILRQALTIGQNMTFQELEEKLIDLSNVLLLKVIDQFKTNSVVYQPQDESQVSFAPKILTEDMKINWSCSAFEIHNLVRALSLKPGAWCYLKENGKKKRVKILLSELSNRSGNPGEAIEDDSLIVGCAVGSIKILLIQSEGKKVISAIEWLQGVKRKQFKFF